MDPRLVQLSRIFETELPDDAAARAAVSARPEKLAEALLLEASASDDVTSAESATDYLATRLAYLAGLVDPAAEAAIRARFAELVTAW